MNRLFSDTNCIISSADPDGINTVTVTSSESHVPITSDTHAHTQAPDNIGLIAAVAVVIIVLLGIMIVFVVIILLVKKRYCSNRMCHSALSFSLFIRKWQRQKRQSYEIVSDLPKPKSSTGMASAHCESKTSSLPLKPTIEDIHDRSENEKDTPNKMSMKNVLYEPGKCKVKVTFYAVSYVSSLVPGPTPSFSMLHTEAMKAGNGPELGTRLSILLVVQL